jgi:hypothetical protein
MNIMWEVYYIMEHDPDAVYIERACWIAVLCAAGAWRADLREGCKTCPTIFVHAGWGVCFQV